MKQFGLPFEEKLIRLDTPEFKGEIAKYSLAGKVPVLLDGDLRIWDSLAICEYLSEKFPEKHMWPLDYAARAKARSVAAEMHSGFPDLRKHLSHTMVKDFPNYDYSPAQQDIDRIQNIWTECLSEFGGPYLFGTEFSIADAMYAPVVNRFEAYHVSCSEKIQQYCHKIRALPVIREWIEAAHKE